MARKKKTEAVEEATEVVESKTIKVKVIKPFFDKEAKRNRMVNDVLDVENERYRILAGENRYNTVFVEPVE